MKQLTRTTRGDLKWIQPSAFKQQFELRANDELAGTLIFRSAFGTFATGESASGCWTFKRVGFCQTRATVRLCGSPTDLAIFKNNTWSGGGTLEFPDGRQLLVETSFWRASMQFKTQSGEPLVRFNTGGMIHLSATIVIEKRAEGLEELPWILMLGWYLIVMMNSDAAASAAIIG